MSRRVRIAAALAGCLVLGGLANLALGPSPAAVSPVVAAEQPWQPLGMRLPDLAAAGVTWESRAPRGAAPKPQEAPPPPPPPAPVPVGIVGSGGARQAIFLVHGVGELRLPVGGTLPDGGRVLGISGMAVHWVDGEGQAQERRMFLDPAQLPTKHKVR